MVGRNQVQQVRIERLTANGTTLALYTVLDVHDQETDAGFMDYTSPKDLHIDSSEGKLGISCRHVLRILLPFPALSC